MRRKSIQRICELHDLDLKEFMHRVNQSPHLNDLPTPVDEYTLIDVWYALRTRLHSVAHKSAMRMQRMRSKPAAGDRAAKHDPVFFINAEGKTAKTAGLRENLIILTIMYIPPPRLFHRSSSAYLSTNSHDFNPKSSANDVYPIVRQYPTICVQDDRPADCQQVRWA
ncbi:hypothetical protein FRC06_009202 [Ceratobasidium sp. 370]|nr:hypothetical protein FRC06_009202 [Ceratobasidium sp. 370]